MLHVATNRKAHVYTSGCMMTYFNNHLIITDQHRHTHLVSLSTYLDIPRRVPTYKSMSILANLFGFMLIYSRLYDEVYVCANQQDINIPCRVIAYLDMHVYTPTLSSWLVICKKWFLKCPLFHWMYLAINCKQAMSIIFYNVRSSIYSAVLYFTI